MRGFEYAVALSTFILSFIDLALALLVIFVWGYGIHSAISEDRYSGVETVFAFAIPPYGLCVGAYESYRYFTDVPKGKVSEKTEQCRNRLVLQGFPGKHAEELCACIAKKSNTFKACSVKMYGVYPPPK